MRAENAEIEGDIRSLMRRVEAYAWARSLTARPREPLAPYADNRARLKARIARFVHRPAQ